MSVMGTDLAKGAPELDVTTQTHITDLFHKVPLPVLQESFGTQVLTSISGLRASSKAGLQLVNSLITEVCIRLRSQHKVNVILANFVSQLRALHRISIRPETGGHLRIKPSRLNDPLQLNGYGLSPFTRAVPEAALCEFLRALSVQLISIIFLSLHCWTLTEASAQLLASNLPNLRTLTAASCCLPDSSQHAVFEQLSKLSSLQSVSIGIAPGAPALDVSSVSALMHITELSIDCHKLGTLGSLSSLTNLHSLALAGYGRASTEPELPRTLQQLENLQILELGTLHQADVDALAQLTALTRIIFARVTKDTSVPSLPSVQQVCCEDPASLASVLLACPNATLADVGPLSWQLELGPPGSSSEDVMAQWEGLVAVDAWMQAGKTAAGVPRDITAYDLQFNEIHAEFWSLLWSGALGPLPAFQFWRRLGLNNVHGIDQCLIDFIACKFPLLTDFTIWQGSADETVSLMPFVGLPLVSVTIFECQGLTDAVESAREAFENHRPGQVHVEFDAAEESGGYDYDDYYDEYEFGAGYTDDADEA